MGSQTDSPEIPDSGENSEIPSLPSGKLQMKSTGCACTVYHPDQTDREEQMPATQELTVEGDFLCDVLGLDALLLVGDEDHAVAIRDPPVLVDPLLGHHGCQGTNTHHVNNA